MLGSIVQVGFEASMGGRSKRKQRRKLKASVEAVWSSGRTGNHSPKKTKMVVEDSGMREKSGRRGKFSPKEVKGVLGKVGAIAMLDRYWDRGEKDLRNIILGVIIPLGNFSKSLKCTLRPF